MQRPDGQGLQAPRIAPSEGSSDDNIDQQAGSTSLDDTSSDLDRSNGSSISRSSSFSGKSRLQLSKAASSIPSMTTTIEHVLKDQSICTSVIGDEDASDEALSEAEEEVEPEMPERHFVRTHEYVNWLIVIILIAIFGWSGYTVTTKILWYKMYYAFSIYALLPINVIFFAFAISIVVKGIVSLGFGGVKAMEINSQHYSAIKTPVQKGVKLPEIVVQMPVYKESLKEVIKLTYFSVRRAMDYYISKGGTVKFVVCDDGIQVIPADDAIERANFYVKHGIAFVARPPHNRLGVFKKASNMNYQLSISERVTQLVSEDPSLTPESALLRVWEEWDREFVAGGDLVMNDDCLILLIDADTKVPEKCMYDVVGEFLENGEVAYTQHSTMPFDNQQRNYWEQYVSAFTCMIYTQGIGFSVAYGDGAPLVGHNAFLRWSAIKKVGYSDSSCRFGQTKYWSECSVSEDFDMYMRLASLGGIGRYVTYTGPEFQEGISLTYLDEVTKFKKFAYGACEMLFNPFKQWPTRGPFSPTLLNFLCTTNIRWYQKLSMLTYISSYLAMGGAVYLTLFEGVMSIVDPGFHDRFVVRGFDIMLTCTVIFNGIGTLCSCVIFEWRKLGASGAGNLIKIFWKYVKWMPMFALFFGSICFHITLACGTYLFGFKATWGATAKESQKSSCWQAFRNTVVGYKYEYIFYILVLAGYSYCLHHWQIGMYRGWAVPCYFAGHIVGPILLNPRIMTLTW